MTDRIVLTNLRFEARHGVLDWERVTPQAFEVDVELILDLEPAGTFDDLERTVDYGEAYASVRAVVEGTSFLLIEALAQAISDVLLAHPAIDEVVVRVRKPGVQLGGPLDHAAVEIRRRRHDR